jgi:predicted Zn-dependent peptidase
VEESRGTRDRARQGGIRLELAEHGLPGGVRLRVFPTRKFKSRTLRLFVHMPLEPGAGRRALLAFVLRRGTRRHPRTRDLMAHLEEMYGAELRTDVLKVGTRHLLSVQVSLPAGRYVGDSDELLWREAVALLRDVVFDPPRDAQGALLEAYVEQEKETLRHAIEGIMDDKGQYAMYRLVQEMFRGTPFAVHRYGEVEDFQHLTHLELTELYEQILRESPMDLYVVGDLEPQQAVQDLQELWHGALAGRQPRALPSPGARYPRPLRPRHVVEEMDVTQGKLALGLWTGIGFGDPLYPALVVANGLLGGFSHSRLHRVVRETHSMAYYAYSRLEGTQGSAFVTAGIEPQNLGRVLALIEEQIQEVQAGRVTEEEWDRTLRALRHHIRVAQDSASALILGHLERSLFGLRWEAEARMAELEAVGREDVAKAASQLTLDTVYFLSQRGVAHEIPERPSADAQRGG